MAKNTEKTANAVEEAVEPTVEFSFEEVATEQTSKMIVGGTELTSISNKLAADCMRAIIAGDANLKLLAKNVQESADYDTAHTLVNGTVVTDAVEVPGMPTDALKRLLESKRSDRSRAKKLLNTANGFLRFMSDVIAEMLIRDQLGLEYKSTQTSNFNADTASLDDIGRKIRSLQSKLCNLRKEGKYAPADWHGWTIISNVEDEIAELQTRRPSNRTVASKTINMSDIRTALASMTEEQRAELLALAAAQN